jgi:hypothetical protein
VLFGNPRFLPASDGTVTGTFVSVWYTKADVAEIRVPLKQVLTAFFGRNNKFISDLIISKSI